MELEAPGSSPCHHLGLELEPQRSVSLYFVVTLGDPQLQTFVRLTFSPFSSEECHFVYHYYKIDVSTSGQPVGEISGDRRATIVRSVQQAYESVSFKPGRYPFRFGPEEFVATPPRKSLLIPGRLHLTSFDELSWPPMAPHVPGHQVETNPIKARSGRQPSKALDFPTVLQCWRFSQASSKAHTSPRQVS